MVEDIADERVYRNILSIRPSSCFKKSQAYYSFLHDHDDAHRSSLIYTWMCAKLQDVHIQEKRLCYVSYRVFSYNNLRGIFVMFVCLFVCWRGLFVCLFNRSVHADTRIGPEGTKLKQMPEPGLKSLYIQHADCEATPNNQGEQFCFQPQCMRKENLDLISFTIMLLSNHH